MSEIGQLLELAKTNSTIVYFTNNAKRFKGCYVAPLWGENIVRLLRFSVKFNRL